MKGTEKCIVCLKPAIWYRGHVVVKNGEDIIAGWCEEHHDIETPYLMNKKGCYGGYNKIYGKINI